MTKLHLISSNRNASPIADVVFVHGLDGDPITSWGFEVPESWVTWFANDRPDLALWSVEYESSSSSWKGRALPLAERAVSILATLESNRLGCRPIYFVSHSMGGLLVKQMLKEAHSTSTEYRTIADAVRKVIFFATPHSGSDVANLAGYLKHVLRPTVAIDDLKAHAPHLLELNRWFRNNAHALNIAVRVFYETLPTSGLTIVTRDSADPYLANVTPIAIERNHIQIVRPTDRSDLAYLASLSFLNTLPAFPEAVVPPGNLASPILSEASGPNPLSSQGRLADSIVDANGSLPSHLSPQREQGRSVDVRPGAAPSMSTSFVHSRLRPGVKLNTSSTRLTYSKGFDPMAAQQDAGPSAIYTTIWMPSEAYLRSAVHHSTISCACICVVRPRFAARRFRKSLWPDADDLLGPSPAQLRNDQRVQLISAAASCLPDALLVGLAIPTSLFLVNRARPLIGYQSSFHALLLPLLESHQRAGFQAFHLRLPQLGRSTNQVVRVAKQLASTYFSGRSATSVLALPEEDELIALLRLARFVSWSLGCSYNEGNHRWVNLLEEAFSVPSRRGATSPEGAPHIA